MNAGFEKNAKIRVPYFHLAIVIRQGGVNPRIEGKNVALIKKHSILSIKQ